MSGFSGADVAQLRQLAARMKNQSNRLDEIVNNSNFALMVAEWTGNDIDAIRNNWRRSSVPTLKSLAAELSDVSNDLERQAEQQEQASGASASVLSPGPGSFPWPGNFSWPGGWEGGLPNWGELAPGFFDRLIDGGDWISNRVDWANEAVTFFTGKDFDAWDVVPGGSYASSVLKGIGLGDAAARLAEAIQRGDLSGGMLAAADGAASFVPTPISLLYGGLKDQIDFYIPLDQDSRDEHLAWMENRGYTSQAIADRYTGLQGFIDLGNDNVERKAPWLNRAADAALGGVGEWLYNIGIKLY